MDQVFLDGLTTVLSSKHIIAYESPIQIMDSHDRKIELRILRGFSKVSSSSEIDRGSIQGNI
jgi:hypothetical protein